MPKRIRSNITERHEALLESEEYLKAFGGKIWEDNILMGL